MRKLIVACLIAIGMLLSSNLAVLHAQEEKPTPEDSKAKTEHRTDNGQQSPQSGVEKPMHPYRADFLISELDDGKPINTRHYSMVLNVGGVRGGSWHKVQIGTKVPVSTGQAQFQYLDVGTEIQCKLTESAEDLSIDVISNFSSLSGPDAEHSRQPVVRQVSLNGDTLVTSGKPVIIGTADDPGSRHQFQLEVTVTRLR